LEGIRARINEGRASVSFTWTHPIHMLHFAETRVTRKQASPLDEMESAIDTQLAQYRSQTSRKKYLPNVLFVNFRTLLWVGSPSHLALKLCANSNLLYLMLPTNRNLAKRMKEYRR
jgi:hypothetical protein